VCRCAIGGPMEKLLVLVSTDPDGIVFELDADARKAIRGIGGRVKPARKLFVSYDTHDDFRRSHGPVFDHVALVLTGLPTEKLGELGGVRFIDAMNDKTIHLSRFRANAKHKEV
jgi:hypothetical protein